MPPNLTTQQIDEIVGRLPDFAKGARQRLRARLVGRAQERTLGDLRERFLGEGGQVRDAGVAAIRDFNPDDFLGADSLRSLFDEATATNFAPQLSALQARNARRGVRGPLATTTEGTLASAFQRNLLARVGENRGLAARLAFGRGTALAGIGTQERAQGLSLFGTEIDANQAEQARLAEERARRNSTLGSLIGTGLRIASGGLLGGGGG